MAIRLHRVWLRGLDLHLLRLVLLDKITHSGLHIGHALLQLQLTGLCCLRLVDGDGGVLDGLRVCEENIWVSSSPFTNPFNNSIIHPLIQHYTY